MVIIPRANTDRSNFPCWIPIVNSKGEERRPNVKCKCGAMTGLGKHHIHKDGTVTPSYFHSPEQMPGGCGYHEHIKLDGYDGLEWLPGRTEEEALKDFD